MVIKITNEQARLLSDVLSMQLQIETEHLTNCLDAISKHDTRSIIGRMERLRRKIDMIIEGGAK